MFGIQDRRYYRRREAQRIRAYLSVNAEELVGMPDIELFAVPWYRLTLKYNVGLIRSTEELERLNTVQRAFWITNIYEQKNYGEGLLGFLNSEYRYTAPLLISALSMIGADAHLKLLNGFVKRSGIDLSDLSEFSTDGLNRKKKKLKLDELRLRYDIDSFDMEYRKLLPIEDYLLPYIRANAEQILAEIPDGKRYRKLKASQKQKRTVEQVDLRL